MFKLLIHIFMGLSIINNVAFSQSSNLVIHSLSHQGELTFNSISNATSYRIEWTTHPGGTWTTFQAAAMSLDTIAPTPQGMVTVAVPMCYRVVAHVATPWNALGRIEAESFSEMQGIQLEPGGNAIGYFDVGDWLKFEQVDFGTSVSSVVFSVAKQSSGGAIELRLGDLNGPVMGTFEPQSTGSWTTYSEQRMNVLSTNGTHDLYLVGVGENGICNIDWLQFSTNSIYVPSYTLHWEDEFDGTNLNTQYWHPVQHGDVDNGELQFYTDRPQNISVSNSYLWLTAMEENYTGTGPWMSGYKTTDYTSGKIQGQGKISFQYGKIESRMKIPRGEGTWPAFWMLGDNIFDPGVGWPKCGEIDIMEHANIQNAVGAAIHTEAYNHTIGTQRAHSFPLSDYDTEFHIYGVEWTPEKLSFYVDDTIFFTLTKATLGSTEAEWPFDQPFWLILNLAVGGAWGGDPTNGSYPYVMQVDWVRVYQDSGG